MKKLRVLAVLAIVLILSITCLTTEVRAASTVASGTCGNEATWKLDSDGVLTISGKGAMRDYGREETPWDQYSEAIQKVVIKSGITSVGWYAFYSCNNITSVKIPDGITRIGSHAFYNCYSMTSIQLPNSVTSIEEYAFSECDALTSFTIPSSVKTIGANAFTFSHGLASITIPGTVDTIGRSAFQYCSNLSEITISEGVKTIEDHAFSDCDKLTSVTIPASVTTVGISIFSSCEYLNDIYVSNSNKNYTSVDGVLYTKDKTKILCCPGNRKGYYEILPTVTSIGASAFEDCDELTGIIIPAGVTEIEYFAFLYCGSLKSIELPKGLTNIVYGAFQHCNSLTDITIPDNVTCIEDYAFAGCESLSRITLPSKLETIGWNVFTSCKSLSNINIPSNVTQIGGYAFSNCKSLTSITIPSSVTWISYGVFRNCEQLSSVTFMGDKPEMADDVFDNTTTTAYYPENNKTWEGIKGQNFGGTITWKTHDRVELKITTQPKTAYAKSGSTVKTTVKAQGSGLKYQWYIRNADQSKYSKSSVTSATYSCKMNDTTKGRRVYCVITDKHGESVKTNTVMLRMAATITTQPKSVTVEEGSKAKVTVKASGDGLEYQWYVKNAGKDSFSKSSITKSTYSVEMSDKADGRKVYCVVTDKYGKTDKSETVTLSMKKPLKITAQPKSVAVKAGVTAKVTVKATGNGLKYQWYIKNAGAEKYSKSSITSDTYSVKMSDKVHGRRAYCVVKDEYGNTVRSNTVLLRMAATITSQPKSVTVEKGETAKVTVKATGDGLSYQWYVKNKGADSFTKSSITKSTYSVEMSSKVDGRKVYCVVTDKYGKTAKSDTATLTMKVSFEITSQPKSVKVDKGETAKVTVKATGNDLTYTWYYMNAGQTKFSKSSVTKSTYSVEMSNKVSGRQIYCVVKDASGKKLQTNTVILNITGGPEITTQPKNKTVAAGKSVTLSVDAEGKGLTYEWYFKDPKDSEYRLSAAISNDPSTYSFLMLEKMDGRKVFCVITDSSGRKTTSKTITIKLA